MKPFNIDFNANESVSLNNGAAMFRTNVLSIPGRGGFDLILDLIYDSSRADTRTPRWDSWSGNTVGDARDFHGLGIGWVYDLPRIIEDTLFLPGVGSFPLEGNTFRDHTLQDMRLTSNTSFVSGSIRSTQQLAFHNGTRCYFNAGSILGMVDRFGNTIRFEYANIPQFQNRRLLTRIVDTNGKIVQWNYQSAANAYVGGTRNITITSPDGGLYSIASNFILDGNHAGIYNISHVRNQVGRQITFWYDSAPHNFCLISKSPSTRNHTLLLRNVHYSSTATLRYSYSQHSANLGRDGSRQIFKVATRDVLLNGNEAQRTNFSYQGDATAFPNHVERPPANHTYTTTLTQNNGLRTVYTFNNHSLPINQRMHNGNVLVSEQITTYNADRLPISVILTEHANGLRRTNQTSFVYNRYGQVLEATSPLAQGSTNIRYRTIHTYDNRYGLLRTKSYMPDPSTTIREVNTLSTNRRNITATSIYENGRRMSHTTFAYDSHGNVTRVQKYPTLTGTAVITNITYSSGALPSQIQTTNVRDADNRLIGNIARNFTYDTMWRKLTEADPNGSITRWQYDRVGRVTQITHPNGGAETFAYNDTQSTKTHHTVLGAQYVHRYNGLGYLQSITSPTNMVILANTYDNRMRLITTSNAQGLPSSQQSSISYDIFDREIDRRNLNAAGQIMQRITTEYQDILDSVGNARVTKTIHGDATSPTIQSFIQYDRFGRKTQESVVGGKTATYTYDIAGRVTREQSIGVDNRYTYGIFGVTSVRNIENNISYKVYNGVGQLTCATDFMNNAITFNYDALGRQIQRSTPFERVGDITHHAKTKYYYDNSGNLTSTSALTSRPGQPDVWSTTTNAYAHNLLTSARVGGIGTAGITTTYTYNPAGQPLTKHVGGATTTYSYNNQGQLTRETDALGRAESYTYDANGHLLTTTDRNGRIFRNRYDNMGRLTELSASTGDILTHGYAPTGARICTTFNTSGQPVHLINYFHDAQGRLTSQTETGGVTKTYAYNAANNPTNMQIFVDGTRHQRNNYHYNAAQRLQSVLAGSTTVTYAYDANGNRTTETHGNATMAYSYNAANLVTRMTNRSAAELSRFDYSYFLDGNVQVVADTRPAGVRTSSYMYDHARRLTLETDTSTHPKAPPITKAYGFDNRGNRTIMEINGAGKYSTNYVYDLNNRLLSERTGLEDAIIYTYDNNGNQRTRVSDGQTETRSYNGFGQLTNLTAPGTTASYTYRADGLRHGKTVNGVATTHVWNGSHIALERNASGAVVQRYYRTLGGQMVTSRHHGTPLYNARGDVMQRADSRWDVRQDYHYSAFGTERSQDVNNQDPFRFAGEYFDAERNEYYLRARSYNARLGRFTTPDPHWNVGNMMDNPLAMMQAANLYAYTANNPVRYTDPSGMMIPGNTMSIAPSLPLGPWLSQGMGTSPNMRSDCYTGPATVGNISFRPNSTFSGGGSSSSNRIGIGSLVRGSSVSFATANPMLNILHRIIYNAFDYEWLGVSEFVTVPFLLRVLAISASLEINPDYLMKVMDFETGGSFDPAQRNMAGGSATGLIQFMPETAAGLGTTTEALSQMTAYQQLDYVYAHFRRHSGRMNSLGDVYMAVLWPAAVGRGEDGVLWSRHLETQSRFYYANRGLDLNQDGIVTVGEATERVRIHNDSFNRIRRSGR